MPLLERLAAPGPKRIQALAAEVEPEHFALERFGQFY